MLFLGKKNDPFCARAAEVIRHHFPAAVIVMGTRGNTDAALDLRHFEYDYILSYLYPHLLPDYLLKKAKKAAINFHPGPPAYPGIGCTNFAVYNEEKVFGVTCHHMVPKADSGPIIVVRRFPLLKNDSLLSLTQKCHAHILTLFYDIVDGILEGRPLPVSAEQWMREAYKRTELNDLCKLTPDMSAYEMRRRIRATSYPGAPGACLEMHGLQFVTPSGN